MKFKNSSFKKIEKSIKKAGRILVACHLGPDGDAIGSLVAFGLYLKKIGKRPYMLCASGVPQSMKFVPGASLIKSKHPKAAYDLIIGLDYGALWRLGLDGYLKKYPKIPLMILDHHPIMEQEADFGIIRPDASSTSEIIYDYFKAIKFRLDKKIAHALAMGVLTDTGFFKYSNRPEPLKIIIELMRFGIRPLQIDNALNGHVKIEAMRFGGKILNRAKIHKKGQFAYSWLKRAELNKHHLTLDDLRGLVERLRNLREGKFAVLFVEDSEGKIRGELRSRPDKKFDVGKFAEKLGGGGHKYAAGFRFRGTIDGAIKIVAKYARK
jgi:phosphoesterase RecJ-like protein